MNRSTSTRMRFCRGRGVALEEAAGPSWSCTGRAAGHRPCAGPARRGTGWRGRRRRWRCAPPCPRVPRDAPGRSRSGCGWTISRRPGDAIPFDFVVERRAVDLEDLRRTADVPVVLLEHARDVLLLHGGQRTAGGDFPLVVHLDREVRGADRRAACPPPWRARWRSPARARCPGQSYRISTSIASGEMAWIAFAMARAYFLRKWLARIGMSVGARAAAARRC